MRVTYRCYINGEFYGAGPRKYMTELFRDYVETCGMHGKPAVDFRVERKERTEDVRSSERHRKGSGQDGE